MQKFYWEFGSRKASPDKLVNRYPFQIHHLCSRNRWFSDLMCNDEVAALSHVTTLFLVCISLTLNDTKGVHLSGQAWLKF